MLLPPPERPPALPVALAGWASTTQVWPVRCLEGRGNVGCCGEIYCTISKIHWRQKIRKATGLFAYQADMLLLVMARAITLISVKLH